MSPARMSADDRSGKVPAGATAIHASATPNAGGASLDTTGLSESIANAFLQAVVATDLDGDIIYWDRRAEEMYGWQAAEVIGRNILGVTPADQSREPSADILKRIREGDGWSGPFLARRRDGSCFWAELSGQPLRDKTGRAIGIVGFSHAREEPREEQLALINRELKHQITNLLAIASAIVTQTFRSAAPIAAMSGIIVGRLAAIAAAQHLLSVDALVGSDLGALIEAVVCPVCPAPPRIDIQGQPVTLPCHDATPFALILHELATNAVKHGAWRGDEGKVTVAWTVQPGDTLDLRWRESVALSGRVPRREGFGSQLIKRGLRHGRVETVIRPNGLDFHLELPMTSN